MRAWSRLKSSNRLRDDHKRRAGSWARRSWARWFPYAVYAAARRWAMVDAHAARTEALWRSSHGRENGTADGYEVGCEGVAVPRGWGTRGRRARQRPDDQARQAGH